MMAKAGPTKTPSLRAGMGDLEAPSVEVWTDDDYRRATELQAILSPPGGGAANRPAVPVAAPAVWRGAYRAMLCLRAVDQAAREQVGKRRIGSYAETRGYEAAIVGAVA